MSLRHHGGGPDQEPDAIAPAAAKMAEFPRRFETTGELVALMAALPPDTPVSVAQTVHVDPDLEAGAETVTASIAKVVSLLEPAKSDHAECSTQRPSCRPVTGVELGAVIVAMGGPAPQETYPYQPYESALDALSMGDVISTLAEHARLLSWIADLLGDPLQADAVSSWKSVSEWVDSDDLRKQLDIEARRLRYSCARIAGIREQIAADEIKRLTRRARRGEADGNRDPQ
ncbi:hypothetical protein [Micromonospora aurantiaca (nom. illeg.)]|uniref:hypothetical protein n=1 Tax=Micromonospora aurantiaca (nom. illeg.) TaxID=47850 RepID=UPI0033EE6594